MSLFSVAHEISVKLFGGGFLDMAKPFFKDLPRGLAIFGRLENVIVGKRRPLDS